MSRCNSDGGACPYPGTSDTKPSPGRSPGVKNTLYAYAVLPGGVNMFIACHKGHTEAATLLVDRGVDVDKAIDGQRRDPAVC